MLKLFIIFYHYHRPSLWLHSLCECRVPVHSFSQPWQPALHLLVLTTLKIETVYCYKLFSELSVCILCMCTYRCVCVHACNNMCVQSKYLLNGVTLPLIGLVAISHLCATHHCSWESCPRFSSTFCSFRFLIYLEFLFICLVCGVFCLFVFSLFFETSV